MITETVPLQARRLATLAHVSSHTRFALSTLPTPEQSRCRRPKQQQVEDHKQELMTLVDICVDAICEKILIYEAPLPFDCLPPELVRRLLDSLMNHKALTKLTVGVNIECYFPLSISI